MCMVNVLVEVERILAEANFSIVYIAYRFYYYKEFLALSSQTICLLS